MFNRLISEDTYTLFSMTYAPAMVKDAIRIGEKIIKGEDYEEMVVLPTLEVNKDNAENYLDPNSPF